MSGATLIRLHQFTISPMLMQEWVQTRYVDKELHRDHPELRAVGFMFSLLSTPQPSKSDPGYFYQQKTRKEVDKQLQDAMMYLSDMGFLDFDINHEALKLALIQGFSRDGLVEQAIEYIEKLQAQNKSQEEEKEKLDQISLLIISKNSRETILKNQMKKPLVCSSEGIEELSQQNSISAYCAKQLQTLEELRQKIMQDRQSQSQDWQANQLELQFRNLFNDLLTQKERLQILLKFKSEPSEQKINEKIEIYQEEEETCIFEQKIKDLKLYKELVSQLPHYHSLIDDKPNDKLQNLEQVLRALEVIPQLKDKLKLLEKIFKEGKEVLYHEVLFNLDDLYNSEQYLQMKKYLDGLAHKKDWNMMNSTLFQSYHTSGSQEIIQKHSSVKYFLHFRSEYKNEVMNPVELQALIQELEIIFSNELDYSQKLQLKQLLRFFQEGNIDDAMKICNSISQKQQINQVFQKHNLKHFQNHLEVQKLFLEQLEFLNFQQEFRQSYYFQALASTVAVSSEKTLIINQFIQLHQRHDPQFKQNNLLDLIKLYKILNENFNFVMSPINFIVQVIDDPGNYKLMNEILQNLDQDQILSQDFIKQIFQEENNQQDLKSLFAQFSEKDPTAYRIFLVFLENYPGMNYDKAKKFIHNSLSFEDQLQKVLQWSNYLIIQGEINSLYTIKDFMKIDICINLEILENKICNDFKTEEKIEKDELVYLLFQKIKKRLSFDKLIENLYTDYERTQFQITSMNLFCFLLDTCESELRTMLFLACSKYMPVPLIANRPQVNFMEENSETLLSQFENRFGKEDELFDIIQTTDENQQNNQKYLPRVYEELIYSFEKYKGILAFKFNTNKLRQLKGCTTLTNKTFNRQFELHSSLSPIANHGQVEIQFDFNFVETHYVTVGEVHGYLQNQELIPLISQFNIFLIHCFKEDAEEVKKFINRIIKGSLVFIIQQDENQKQSFFSENELNQYLIEMNISSFDKLNRNHTNNLSQKINQRVKRYTSKWKEYMVDAHLRLKTLQEFAEFSVCFNKIHNQIFYQTISQNIPSELEELKEEEEVMIIDQFPVKQNYIIQKDIEQKTLIVETVSMIREFMEKVDTAKLYLKSRQILPINELYSRICLNENQIQRDLSLKSEAIDKLRNMNEKDMTSILQTAPSELSNELHNILSRHDQFVGIVSVLSKLIKCINNNILDPLFAERAQLQDQASKQGINIGKKDKIMENIKIITDEIDKQQFSIEFLFREFYIKEKIVEQFRKKDPQSVQNEVKPFEKYLKIASQQIENGQPFELIDGDNLRFIHGVYEKVQNDYKMNDEILVISVIGPQSSGKSLILNTLFGAQFQSSAGRCTKGVYGCLIDIKDQKDQFTRFKKILILDTEGIQSTEKKDSGFDHRIVFYILCISHIVLVCNKGEINSQMQEMIKIAVYSLSEFKTLVTQMPQINIIMNMIPQIDERNLEQTYQNLAETLMKMGMDKNNSNLVLNIRKDNVFILPQAFSNLGEYQDLIQSNSSPIFATMVEKLNQNIQKFLKNPSQEHRNYTLNSFFSFASKTWEIINNFHDIDKFNSLEQRKQGMELQQYFNTIIDEEFKQRYNEIKNQVENIAELELSKHFDAGKTSRKQLFDKIDINLSNYRSQIKDSLIKRYCNFCEEKKIEKKVQNMYSDNLLRMICTNFIEQSSIINIKIQKYFESKSNMRGNKQLQEIICKVLENKQDKIEELEANQIFEKNWNILIKDREIELRDFQAIQNETFENAYHFYRDQVKGLSPKQEDIYLMNKFMDSHYRDESLLQFMEFRMHLKGDDLKQDFLSFTGHNKAIEPEKFLHRNEDIGKYIPKLPYYNQVPYNEFYNWYQVVIERFNFKNLENRLGRKLNSSFDKQKKNIQFMKSTEVIEKIVEQIQIEGKYFQIGITDEFQIRLNLIRECYEAHFIKGKNCYPRKQLADSIIKMKNKQSIIKCFKFSQLQSENNRYQGLNYKYFEPNNIIDLKNRKIKYHQEFCQQNYRTLVPHVSYSDFSYQSEAGREKVNKYFLIPNREITKNNDSLQSYFEQIQRAESFNLQAREKATITAKVFFFDILEKREVIKEIQQVVLDNIYRIKDNPNRKKSYKELIEQLKQTQDINITSQFSPLSQHIFQRVASEVQTIVAKIDFELEAFCLNVSDQGNYILHQIAQTLLICIFIEIMRIYEYAPHFDFLKTEATERKLFVAKLTSKDDVRDKSLAEKASNQLFKMIIEQTKQEQIDYFGQVVQQYVDHFKIENIIKEIEDYILKVAVDFQNGRKSTYKALEKLLNGDQIQFQRQENNSFFSFLFSGNNDIIDYPGLKDRNLTWPQIIQMYVEPDKFFEKCFTQSWKIKTAQEIKRLQKNFIDQRKKILDNFIAYFKMFKDKMKTKDMKFSHSMFLPQGIDSNSLDDQKEYEQYCNKACAKYFALILRCQWNPKENLKFGPIEVIPDPDQPLVDQDDLKQFKIDKNFKLCLVENLDNEMISNLQIFVDSIIHCLETERNSVVQIDESIIIQNQEHLMRQQSTGCNQLCPLCRRKCDFIHQEREDQKIHNCKTGHQIIGFGGSYHARNNYAITYGCHELDDNDTVHHEGQLKIWATYKLLFPKWNFLENKTIQSIQQKEEKIQIWNLIGPIVCQYYKKNDNNSKITFSMADNQSKRMGSIEKIMYILVLDSSSSMKGDKWEKVLQESKRFIGVLNGDQILKANSKVSCISYDQKPSTDFENEVPNPSLIDRIQFKGGSTNFDKPLLKVKDIISKCLNDFHGFHVCFLSDGEADFPNQGVKSIKENNQILSKFRITTVAFGNDKHAEKVLLPLAQKFGTKGCFKKALDPEDFKNALIEMIPNEYRSQIA